MVLHVDDQYQPFVLTDFPYRESDTGYWYASLQRGKLRISANTELLYWPA